MTSRTPIRLTPHRGPLATPPTSAESSPTLSTPLSDISHYFTALGPALDAAILQHGISALNAPTQQQCRSSLYRQKGIRQGLSGLDTHLCPVILFCERLIYSACDLAKSFAGIVTFCLLLWGLLEWSSYVSGLPRQPHSPISLQRFPLPSPTRDLRCHVDPSSCELRDQHAAVLQFLSEQIQLAKAMLPLSVSLGSPLRTFLEGHRATIPRIIVQHNFTELPYVVQEIDKLANLTEFLDPPLLDFTSGGFIGRSLTLALDELDNLISEPMISHGSSSHRRHQDAHLHAIYWRTTSNLLLEYSAARQRARRLLHRLHAIHNQLLLLALNCHNTRSFEGRSNNWWWKGSSSCPTASTEDGTQVFATGLGITLDNVLRLIAYLDWTTEQLAQTTLRDVLKIRHGADFSSCMMSLQELFAQSRPPTPKKLCFCMGDYGVTPPRPERVGIVVPGSPTVRVGR